VGVSVEELDALEVLALGVVALGVGVGVGVGLGWGSRAVAADAALGHRSHTAAAPIITSPIFFVSIVITFRQL
jgi:hypothetical protein